MSTRDSLILDNNISVEGCGSHDSAVMSAAAGRRCAGRSRASNRRTVFASGAIQSRTPYNARERYGIGAVARRPAVRYQGGRSGSVTSSFFRTTQK